MTSLAQAGSPVRRTGLDPRLRLLLFSLLGIVIYFVILTAIVPGGSSTAAKQVANALTLGSIYALVALGYTMVYGIIELINFAHGDVFMVGTFMSLFFLSAFPSRSISSACTSPGRSRTAPRCWSSWPRRSCSAMTVMGLINITIERFAYRPLRHAPRVAPLITAIGVSLILQNIMQIIVGTGDRQGPADLPEHADRHPRRLHPRAEHLHPGASRS